MKIMVLVKRVLDFNIRPRVRADGSGVDLDNAKMSINPFDEIAVEEAVRLKEAGRASEVLVVSVGGSRTQETLRTALAIGADRAIQVQTEDEVEALAVAKIARALVERERPAIVLAGKQAIDDDCGQTGQMLAALLGWAQGTYASSIAIDGDEAIVRREVDAGMETLRLRLPAVITVDLRLNEPRFATLPNIMRARSKPLVVLSPAELGVDPRPRLATIRVSEPAARTAGVRLPDVAALASTFTQLGLA